MYMEQVLPAMMRQKAWRSEESLENTFRHLVR